MPEYHSLASTGGDKLLAVVVAVRLLLRAGGAGRASDACGSSSARNWNDDAVETMTGWL